MKFFVYCYQIHFIEPCQLLAELSETDLVPADAQVILSQRIAGDSRIRYHKLNVLAIVSLQRICQISHGKHAETKLTLQHNLQEGLK